MNRVFLMTLAACAMLLAACNRDQSSPDIPASAEGIAGLFERIEAESPYVFANMDVLPDDLLHRLWSPLSDVAQEQEAVYAALAEGLEEESPLIAALLREVARLQRPEDLEALGLSANGLWAIHAHEGLPFLHWQLSDGDAFSAFLERISAASSTPLPGRTVDSEALVWLALDELGLGIGIHHDDAFLTIGLIRDNEPSLRRLANLAPTTNPLSPTEFIRFNRERGFTPHGSGYIDFERLLNSLTNLTATTDHPLGELKSLIDAEPACAGELSSLIRQIPRLSAGMTELSPQGLQSTARLEMSSELGQQMARIADTPVSLDLSGAQLAEVGMAFNLVAARDFARGLVGGWINSPPECALFAEVASNAPDWQRALNQPIPPFITNIHGFRMAIDDIAMDQIEQGGFSATLGVFMRNPQMLIGMAQMFSPELAAMDLRPGGEPKPLPPGMLPNLPSMEAFLALSNDAIGLALGESQIDQLGQRLEAGRGDAAILAYSINVERYTELLESLEALGLSSDDDPLANLDLLIGLNSQYSETGMRIELSERGIDIINILRFRD